MNAGTDDSQEHVILELQRGENDLLRVSRRTYEGRAYTDLRVFFRTDDGKILPTKKGVSVRDSEIAQVVEALARIASKVSGRPAPPRENKPSPRQGSLPGTQQPRAPTTPVDRKPDDIF